MSSHTDLDPVIHSPKRLAVMALLSSSATTDFAYLKAHLELSDSDLSKQMTALKNAGYVTIHKSGHGRSGQTRYAMTRTGREAYATYRAHLKSLLGE